MIKRRNCIYKVYIDRQLDNKRRNCIDKVSIEKQLYILRKGYQHLLKLKSKSAWVHRSVQTIWKS